jgi:hypothetical protein
LEKKEEKKEEKKKDRLVAPPAHLFTLKFRWHPDAPERSDYDEDRIGVGRRRSC